MMTKTCTTILILLFVFSLTLVSCAGETEQPQTGEVIGEGVQIDGAWARPATEGRMSAAYFLITNFEDEDDVLTSVQSDVARLVEIHESYQAEGDMMGMREIPELEIPAQTTIRLEQGGLHIMLIQVTRTLSDGDTFELTLNFSKSGEQTIEVPVRL